MKSRIDKTEYTFSKSPLENLGWYKNGKLHRDNDKPAIIWNNGDMSWYINGKFIRISMK